MTLAKTSRTIRGHRTAENAWKGQKNFIVIEKSNQFFCKSKKNKKRFL
jgi:hypothetical protein